MKEFEQIVERAFGGAQLKAEGLPRIDLYMDQILTLLEEALSGGKRHPEERVVTKTMINNYTKEHLIMPVKGKKYSREQVMQLLCVLGLKQTLTLADVKRLMESEKQEKLPFEAVLQESARLEEQLRLRLSEMAQETYTGCSLSGAARELAVALALSGASDDLRRVCEGIVDAK